MSNGSCGQTYVGIRDLCTKGKDFAWICLDPFMSFRLILYQVANRYPLLYSLLTTTQKGPQVKQILRSDYADAIHRSKIGRGQKVQWRERPAHRGRDMGSSS